MKIIKNKPQRKGNGNRVEDQRFGGLTPAQYWEKVFGCESGHLVMVKRGLRAARMLLEYELELEEERLP